MLQKMMISSSIILLEMCPIQGHNLNILNYLNVFDILHKRVTFKLVRAAQVKIASNLAISKTFMFNPFFQLA